MLYFSIDALMHYLILDAINFVLFTSTYFFQLFKKISNSNIKHNIYINNRRLFANTLLTGFFFFGIVCVCVFAFLNSP